MAVIDKGIQYDDSGNYLGSLYEVDGVKLYVCYPQNSSSSEVKTTIFWPGASTQSGYKQSGATYVKDFIKNKSDQLLIAPEYSQTSYHENYSSTANATNTLIDYIEREKGINVNVENITGSSAGGYPSTRQMLEVLKSEYNKGSSVEQKNLYLYDPYSSLDSFNYKFSDEDISLMQKNDTKVTFFTISDRIRFIQRDNTEVSRTLSSLTNNNIDTVIVYGDGYPHNAVLKVQKDDGWFDYQNGTKSLSEIKNGTRNYKIMVNQNGKWVTYKLSDIVGARENPEKYGDRAYDLLRAGEIMDERYVKVDHNYLNQVDSLSGIWKETQAKVSLGYSSTSVLLPQEQAVINSLYKSVENLQNLFSKEIGKIQQASDEYLKMENQLNSATDRLNDNLSTLSFVTGESSSEPTTENVRVVPPYDVKLLANKSVREPIVELTADDLNRLFDYWAVKTKNYDSELRGTGQAFIDAAKANNLDPLLLVGICGKETGRGGSNATNYMRNHNFLGMDYIDPHGNGKSVRYAQKNPLYATDEEALMDCARRISEFYVDRHGANTAYKFGPVGYAGPNNRTYGSDVACIMKEALDYILETDGREIDYSGKLPPVGVKLATDTSAGNTGGTSSTPSTGSGHYTYPSYSGTGGTATPISSTTPSTPSVPETPVVVATEPVVVPVVETVAQEEIVIDTPVQQTVVTPVEETVVETPVHVEPVKQEPVRIKPVNIREYYNTPSSSTNVAPSTQTPTVEATPYEPVVDSNIEDIPYTEDAITVNDPIEEYVSNDLVDEPIMNDVTIDNPTPTPTETSKSGAGAAAVVAGVGIAAGAAAVGYSMYKKKKAEDDDGDYGYEDGGDN